MPLVQQALENAKLRTQDLDGIGVGVGPGNFTGLRISVSAARGLALALGRPAIGVTGFEALAHGQTGPCLAVIPAPRGAAFVQFRGAQCSDPVQVAADDPLTAVVGDHPTAPIVIPAWADQPDRDWSGFGPVTPADLNIAAAIAQIAARRLEDPGPRPAPLYLRAADAAPSRDAPPVILP